jgi:hypothetical protein
MGNSSCSEQLFEQLFEQLVCPSNRLQSNQGMSSSAHAMSRKSPGSVRMKGQRKQGSDWFIPRKSVKTAEDFRKPPSYPYVAVYSNTPMCS